MSDKQNPWGGPDGLKARKVLEDSGLLHILWKWGKGMIHAFGDVAALEISIPHYRDAARVFLEQRDGEVYASAYLSDGDYDAALIAAVLAVGKENNDG